MAQTELFRQGLAELKAGRFAEARKLFNENEEKTGTAKETRELLKTAEANLAAGKLDVGAQQLQAVLERNPGLPEVYVGLARVALFTGQLEYGRIPIDVAAFYDMGVAWTEAERPGFAGGTRGIVKSVGAAVRINVLGLLPVELSAARPFDRVDTTVQWQLGIRQGF